MTQSYNELKIYEKGYNLIPVCKEILSDFITPIQLLRKLANADNNYYLLESVEGGEKWGRYSFLGYNPLLRTYCKNGEVTIQKEGIERKISQPPFCALRSLLTEYKAPRIQTLPTFTGGLVGYFSYEMIGYTEPKLKLKSSDFHDFDLMLFDKVIVFDHLKQKIIVIANYKAEEGKTGYDKALEEIDGIIELIYKGKPLPFEAVMETPDFTCNTSMESYLGMVERTRRYIREGDIFQAVISRRFEAAYHSSLFNAYRILRTTNPSPYMYFMQCGEIQIAGASPETMIKLEDKKLTTFPVAGTRPRGKDADEDLELEKDLMADAKELSEHNMLVDLARNDVGRIAKYSSVKVEDYMKIHRFSKVMHIASVVTGELEDSKDGCDTISALLPAGTLSGAPKFRACEIIDELEPSARGIYGGAIGYLDFSGNLDVCIAIRTAVKKEGKVYVQAGAGIVADSIAEKEYEECASKAGAVMEAIRKASEVTE
ncbi:anthranilate synthase component I [Anaerocolumna cellulosilytica]|uniref:Anthranilate synthase component 1 n=1 Tax=Anaerocolumna cellulosilytica TaxID=433286 RepID=A0A6S6QY18_9FIRM|nr:anthranilate synthase component I [Anaerocolumna cellulosilytica]MBB5194162.1 anthranilate synthase component 1 [Anaerocolumna cellulosilytica]BCJ94626.1 anthranilate synthase component I [Anaerocolumna cellulosilytica]